MTDRRLLARLKKRWGGNDGFYLISAGMERAKKETGGRIAYQGMYKSLAGWLWEWEPETRLALFLAYRLSGSDAPYRAILMIPAYLTIAAVRSMESCGSDEKFDRVCGILREIALLKTGELFSSASAAERRLLQSEAYRLSDDDTKNTCRRRTELYARKKHISEAAAAQELLRTGRLFSDAHRAAGRLYFVLLYGCPVIAAAGLFFGRAPILFCLFSLLPLTELSKRLWDAFYSRMIPAYPPARLKLNRIPDEGRTLVVITALLDGNEELSARLEHCYLTNRDPNVAVGILGDLPPSDRETEEGDAALIRCYERITEALNQKWGRHFCLFVRRRRKNADGEFTGYERKRGALLALVRLLRGREGAAEEFLRIEPEASFFDDVRYILTLDEDTEPGIDGVRRMVSVLLHPANRPVIRDGRVDAGYGIVQPVMETSLFSAAKTGFSRLIFGGGGNSVYASASFELYQTVFGRGIYCGKGLFDVEVYERLLSGAFPENTVLSHDLLEGSRLRCALLTDTALTDSCPKNTVSYEKRHHRWMRGDVQALAFAGKTVRDGEGNRVPNPMSPLARYQLWDNLRRMLVPAGAVLSLFTAGGWNFLWFLSVSYLWFPPVLTLLLTPLRAGKVYHAGVQHPVIAAFRYLLYAVSALFYEAVNAADALCRALYRMLVSRRLLLQWTTASAAERRAGGLFHCLLSLWTSAAGGILLLFVSGKPLYAITALLWIVFPFAAFFLGRESDRQTVRFSGTEESRLSRYVYDLWHYYDATVTSAEHFLPPDNVQFTPVMATAHRTSPTNIGMYLLSCLAVRDFGHITGRELYSRLKSALDTVCLLPRWCGHLYNWYDTGTCQILGDPYVSTVDSGNFIASLVALRQGIREYYREEPRLELLERTLSKLISEADFSLLYDSERGLFRIGVRPSGETPTPNYYDFYLSEARTTSYFAIAAGQVPREHWRKLGRILIGRGGRLGLASWSGTMFEAFMPAIFLPVLPGSLQYEALWMTVREQKKARTAGIWGKSESGYYCFDSEMLYQYKAFGVGSLGLKRGLDREAVFAPYASFLTLSFTPQSALANLNRMKRMGLYGDYGFYEAIDFTPQRCDREGAVVRSYMAHHVGMSITSAANACFGGVFNRRFLADPEMASAKELLSEGIPVGAPLLRTEMVRRRMRRHPRSAVPFSAPGSEPVTDYRAAVLSNGSARMLLSSEGEIRLFCGADAVTGDPFRTRLHGFRVFCRADDRIFEITSEDSRMEERNGGCEVSYLRQEKNLTMEAVFSVSGTEPLYTCRILLDGEVQRVTPLLVFEPVMAPAKEYDAHPAFSDLSLSAEYDNDGGILFYRRRSRRKDIPEKWLAVMMDAGSGAPEFETHRDILGLLYGEKELAALYDRPFTQSSGTLITPFCAFKKTSLTSHGRYRGTFVLYYASSRETAVSRLLAIRADRHRRDIGRKTAESLLPVVRNRLAASMLRAEHFRVFSLLAACLARDGNPDRKPDGWFRREELWRFGISGDDPLLCLSTENLPNGDADTGCNEEKLLIGFFAAYRCLRMAGFRADLCILYKGGDEYLDGGKRTLLSLAEAMGCADFLHTHCGIHLLPEKDAMSLVPALSVLYAPLSAETTFSSVARDCDFIRRKDAVTVRRPNQEKTAPEREREENALLVVHGGFFRTDGAFIVRKGSQTAPWSFIYANHTFGTLVTQNSLGYTWVRNAQTGRITPWDADKLQDLCGEMLLLRFGDEGEEYDLCALSDRVEYNAGCAVYDGEIDGVSYRIRVGVGGKYPVKLITLRISGGGAQSPEKKPKIRYAVTPVMGGDCKNVRRYREENVTFFRSAFGDLTQFEGFLAESGADEGNVRVFLLGAYPVSGRRQTLRAILEKFSAETACEICFAENERSYAELFSAFQPDTGDPAFDLMTGRFLPYQTLVCRLLARTGFYQSGGAYGFRDQLQDSLAMLLYDPKLTRTQIFRAAYHQYEEGDVQHWWHQTDGDSRGVRTRCSDDYLWLPFVSAVYAAWTGDSAVWDARISYLSSQRLKSGEEERYERPERSRLSETLFQHCVRAVEYGMTKGANRLPLIGSGDWNDGMNRVGVKGGGESVWLAFFLWLVLERFIPVCEKHGDSGGVRRYRSKQEELRQAWERAWDKGWYLRGYYDDGTPLGGKSAGEERIFLLPQAFSVFCHAARAETAENSAFDRLYDPENRILKLFSPPFDRDFMETGYLHGYCPGLRENGGQYTHGAVWGAAALLLSGKYMYGRLLLSALNPAVRCQDEREASVYRLEPYCMAGDIYAAQGQQGRGGWSWYTGAAGWFLTTLVCVWLGYVREGDFFSLHPHGAPDAELQLRTEGTQYTVLLRHGAKNIFRLDGKLCENRFPLDKKTHIVEIILDRTAEM